MPDRRFALDGIRSLLFCPGNRADLIAKTPRSRPDAIAVDLEDAVPAAAKDAARATAVAGLRELVASGSGALRLLRVNGAGSRWQGADLDLLADPGWQGVIVPKAERPEDLVGIRSRLAALGRQDALLVAGLESMLGVVEARALAPLADAVYFGAEDYVADLGGVRTPGNQEVGYPRAVVALAARLAGASALDQVTVDFHDLGRLAREAGEARALGFTGKLCIHPAQVGPANAAFSPSGAQVDHALRLVAAYEAEVAGDQRGVVVVDGEMVDLPLYRRARALLALAERS